MRGALRQQGVLVRRWLLPELRQLAESSAPCTASSVPRSLSGMLASTSAQAPQAATLAGLQARLRDALHASHLPASMAQQAQLRAGQVAAVVRQMEAAAQRIARIQRQQMRWDRIEVALASRLAPQFCNAISLSNAGQRLMLVGIPLAASWYLSEPAHCYESYAGQNTPAVLRDRSVVLRALENISEEVAMMARAVYLLLLFVPAALTAPLCIGLGWRRQDWLLLIRWTLEHAGPAFIKWGQWAATRPDMFPTDLCEVLAALQTSAPRHAFKHTRRTVEEAFKMPLEEVFDTFSIQPVASGSIAQIHKATLSTRAAGRSGQKPGTVVAVKVRHPGVSSTMQRDFALMQRAALISSRIPILADLNLQESVRQFGAPLREQLDLKAEAHNLARFNRNFAKWKSLSFPAPFFPWIRTDVLVESFEEGELISHYVSSPGNKHNVALADIGLDSYLKMLLRDNFVHADLHPGNILVRVDEQTRLGGWVDYLKTRLGMTAVEHLVLLDVGMVAELTREDQINLVDFFKAITAKDGRALGHNILQFADKQTCPEPQAFVADMELLFDSLTDDQITHDTSGVIQEMMEKVRQHQVSLRGVVSTVVVTTLVLEGWSSKLNPDLQMMDKLKQLLPQSISERIQAHISAFGSDREVYGRGMINAV